MVATVIINELNGAGATKTNKTSGAIRFKNADNSAVDTANPMVVPTGDSDYSFEKWLRCEVTVAPDTEITNLEVYTDGALFGATDVEIFGKVVAGASFATPVEATGTIGAPATPAATTNIETWTSGAAKALNAGTVTAPGDMGDHIVLVMEVTNTAVQGTLTAETLTVRYDEI